MTRITPLKSSAGITAWRVTAMKGKYKWGGLSFSTRKLGVVFV
jgi:hypothetical protein